MARHERRRVSLGTIVMLLLTALVVIGCILFFALLVGDDLHARTETLIRSLSEQGLFDVSSAAERKASEPTPMYLWLDDTPVPTAPPATPTPAEGYR